MLEAFGRAQDAIIEVAKSTAQMIEKAGRSSRYSRGRVGRSTANGRFPYTATIRGPAKIIAGANGCTDQAPITAR